MDLKINLNCLLITITLCFNLQLLFQQVQCQLDLPEQQTERNSVDLKQNDSNQYNLLNVISSLPKPMRELFARTYISRVHRFSMYAGEKNVSKVSKMIRKPLLGNVPIIPEDVPTPQWIPGEIIASQITKRQLKLIDESVYGPLKAVTKFPSIMSTILVFNKRYDPIILGNVLKYNFGIESEPNGMILEAN